MGAPVVHWEIIARDARRLQDFYSSLFGWKVDANNPMNYGIVNTGVEMGANGGIGQRDEMSPAPNVTFYVQVEDLQHYLNQAELMGGRTVMPVTEIPGMVTLAMFEDPEGNRIGLVKGPQEAPKPARKATRKRAAKPKRKTAAKSKAKGKKKKARKRR